LQVLAQALDGAVGPNPDGNFVLTIEQVTPTQQLQNFKQLGPVIGAALEATAVMSSLAANAPEPARAAAAAAAATAGSGADSSNGSSAAAAAADGVVEQLSDLSLRGDAGGSNAGSSGSNAGSSGSNAGSSGSNAGSSGSNAGSSGSNAGSSGSNHCCLAGSSGSNHCCLAGSSGSNAGSSEQCSSCGWFQLIESHGDQVGPVGQCIQHPPLSDNAFGIPGCV
jgi:hypothetical protein